METTPVLGFLLLICANVILGPIVADLLEFYDARRKGENPCYPSLPLHILAAIIGPIVVCFLYIAYRVRRGKLYRSQKCNGERAPVRGLVDEY